MAPSDLASFLAGEPPPAKGQPAAEPDAAAAEPMPAPETEMEAPAGEAQAGIVLLHDRFELLYEQPVPMLGTVTANAFAARAKRDPQREIFAYVFQTGLPPRVDAVSALRGLDHPTVMKMLDFGVVHWPPEGRERPAVVFERPRGTRLARALKPGAMSEESITRYIVQPALQGLRELKNRRVFHGCINPANMFLREGAATSLQFGECLSAPPGYAQPIVFETIERGMAMPAGRGNGTMAEDLYALGVMILSVLLGRVPGAGLDDRALLSAKIDFGSYAALVGDIRLPLTMTELLRGLLMDDAAQRWTLEDLDLWLSGRRLSPKQAHPPRRASRPLEFAGTEYWNPRSLAHALGDRPMAAHKLIERGDLEIWLRRSLEHDRMADHVEDAVRTAGSGGGGPVEERRLARVMIALDPAAPIRYRGRGAMPEGIGGALGEAFVRGSGIQEVGEMIAGLLPLFWVNMQPTPRPEHVPIAKSFDQVRGYLDHTTMGFGIERCLYQLNPQMPCASMILERHCVLDLEALLWALEAVAGQDDRPADPIDRHIVAFMVARDPDINEKLLVALSHDAGSIERALGIVDLLLEIQRVTRVHPLPQLCAWVVAVAEPAIERYHSRSLRERVRDELLRQAEIGLFRNIYMILVNTDLVRRDGMAFAAAQHEFKLAQIEIEKREAKVKDRDRVTLTVGRQVAAVAASILSAILLIGIIAGSGL